MTTAYYSTVLDHPLETVWSLIRDFDNYPAYIEGVSERFCWTRSQRTPNGGKKYFNPGFQTGPIRSRGRWHAARLEVASYSAASLWPRRALSLRISSSAASAITVPGGKIASAPALNSAS